MPIVSVNCTWSHPTPKEMPFSELSGCKSIKLSELADMGRGEVCRNGSNDGERAVSVYVCVIFGPKKRDVVVVGNHAYPTIFAHLEQ